MRQNAAHAYPALCAEICAKLACLSAAADDNFGTNPETLHWGHVGDLARISDALDEAMRVGGVAPLLPNWEPDGRTLPNGDLL